MWKKAFITLLSVNLLVIVGFTLWWGSLPKASEVQQQVDKVSSQDKTATIDNLLVGEDAINTTLDNLVPELPDVSKFLTYARVTFDKKWDLQIGIRLRDKVIPSDIIVDPNIHNGNLTLHVDSASMGEVYVPTDMILLILKKLPLPAWIDVDAVNQNVNLNLTSRPQRPFGVQVLGYFPDTKQLSVRLTILPRILLPH